jgi:hypothetical protein
MAAVSLEFRLQVLKLRSGERGGVSPLILLVPTFVSGFLGNGNDLIGDTLRQVRNTKNQGAYATPLACPFTNIATSKPLATPLSVTQVTYYSRRNRRNSIRRHALVLLVVDLRHVTSCNPDRGRPD